MKDKIKKALHYRIVKHLAGDSVAMEWGASEGSEGYAEAKRRFGKEFKTITFDEFYQELIITYIASLKRNEKKKYTMKDVTKDSNEEKRGLYNKICKSYKENVDYIILDDNLKYLSDPKNEMKADLEKVDSFWGEIVSKINNEKNDMLREDQGFEEIGVDKTKEVSEALASITSKKLLLGCADIDDDDFIDVRLRNSIEFSEANQFDKKMLGEIEKKQIVTNFNHRHDNLHVDQKRERTKETIFDKIYKRKVDKMSYYEFEEELNKIKEMYFADGEEKDQMDEVDILLIESEYNILLYIAVAFEIEGLQLKGKERLELIKTLDEILIYNNCINGYRDISVQINDKYSGIEVAMLEEKKRVKAIQTKILSEMPNQYYFDKELRGLIDHDTKEMIKKTLDKFELLDAASDFEKGNVIKTIRVLINHNSALLKKRKAVIKKSLDIVQEP